MNNKVFKQYKQVMKTKKEEGVHRQGNTTNGQGEHEMANWCVMQMCYRSLVTSAAFSRPVPREDKGRGVVLLGRSMRRKLQSWERR